MGKYVVFVLLREAATNKQTNTGSNVGDDTRKMFDEFCKMYGAKYCLRRDKNPVARLTGIEINGNGHDETISRWFLNCFFLFFRYKTLIKEKRSATVYSQRN